MVRLTQTIRQQQPTNCLSVFYHLLVCWRVWKELNSSYYHQSYWKQVWHIRVENFAISKFYFKLYVIWLMTLQFVHMQSCCELLAETSFFIIIICQIYGPSSIRLNWSEGFFKLSMSNIDREERWEYSGNPFLPNHPFWSPWKHQKTFGFLMFSRWSKGNIG